VIYASKSSSVKSCHKRDSSRNAFDLSSLRFSKGKPRSILAESASPSRPIASVPHKHSTEVERLPQS